MSDFDWTEFLSLADELSQGEDDCRCRTAISRCYYAVFHHAKEYMTQNHGYRGPGKEQSSHDHLWNHMKGTDAQLHKLSESARVLKSRRVRSDYHGSYQGALAIDARLSVKKAQYIIAKLQP